MLTQVSEIEVDDNISSENFWSGIKVWITRPHILNKRVFGIEVSKTFKAIVKTTACDLKMCLLTRAASCQDFDEFEDSLRGSCDLILCDNSIINGDDAFNDDEVLIQFRNVLPKSMKFKPCVEVLLISSGVSVTFIPFDKNSPFHLLPSIPYEMKHENNKISLSVYIRNPEELQDENVCIEWLKSVVLRKVFNWSKNFPTKPILLSLSQVCPKKYSQIYNDLKTKYGKTLIDMWTEKTDPIKYVYEDIAIAAYIVTLWEEERKLLQVNEKQSFVDLGCGNGLLVHILSSEGYSGIGIDAMKRKIWDIYGSSTKLMEKIIIPFEVSFPKYDWIIGNHSDELTPWIPVIAARSSYKMRVFLLPCCPYSFYGKYERQNSASSCYESYLNFVHELCEQMGFNVVKDKLRIPSTRRICFVCHSRNYVPEEEENIDKRRSLYIEHNSHIDGSNKSDITLKENYPATPVKSFKPRDKIVPIRNCCSLDRKFIEDTVVMVMNLLLKDENFIEVDLNSNKSTWNCGGCLSLGDLAKELGSETLQMLKSQCGGLQTLLKNHKNLFTVFKAEVKLRSPTEEQIILPRGSKRKKKTTSAKKQNPSFSEKLCVFHFHHPNGCPFAECQFLHKNNE